MSRDGRVRFGLAGLTAQTVTHDRQSAGEAISLAVRAAELAEEVGFDHVWSAEHHGAEDNFIPAPLVLLAAVSRATERIRLGTNVIVAPLWEPIRLAEEVAVLDQLSGGRVELGLGLGYVEREYQALGRDFAERADATERTVEVLRQAWAGETVSNRHGATAGIVVTPPPSQEPGPPIWIGGFVRRAVERARRIATGYLGPTVGPDGLMERIGWLASAPMPPGFGISVTAFAFVTPTDADDVGNSPSAVPAVGQRFIAPRPAGAGDPVRVTGRPETCVEQLLPLVKILGDLPEGLTGHLNVCLIRPGAAPAANLESVRLFGEDVLPVLAEGTASPAARD